MTEEFLIIITPLILITAYSALGSVLGASLSAPRAELSARITFFSQFYAH